MDKRHIETVCTKRMGKDIKKQNIENSEVENLSTRHNFFFNLPQKNVGVLKKKIRNN